MMEELNTNSQIYFLHVHLTSLFQLGLVSAI